MSLYKGKVVHYSPAGVQQTANATCRAGILVGIPNPSIGDPDPVEPVSVVTFAPSMIQHVSQVEHDAERGAGTYHTLEECPEVDLP